MSMEDLTRETPGMLTLTVADIVALAEELTTYHAHFAPLFQRREQREWAEVYLRGLLLTDVPRKNHPYTGTRGDRVARVGCGASCGAAGPRAAPVCERGSLG